MNWKLSDYFMVGLVAVVFVYVANKGLEMSGLGKFKA